MTELLCSYPISFQYFFNVCDYSGHALFRNCFSVFNYRGIQMSIMKGVLIGPIRSISQSTKVPQGDCNSLTYDQVLC